MAQSAFTIMKTFTSYSGNCQRQTASDFYLKTEPIFKLNHTFICYVISSQDHLQLFSVVLLLEMKGLIKSKGNGEY